MAIAEGRKGPAKGGVDGEQAVRLRALLAEQGQGTAPSEGSLRGLARLLRRNPTDAERLLWQALTRHRRFAGLFKRQCGPADPGFRVLRAPDRDRAGQSG
jgi:tRNA/rRNA methyltransferase